jgi:hypothetical protein
MAEDVRTAAVDIVLAEELIQGHTAAGAAWQRAGSGSRAP